MSMLYSSFLPKSPSLHLSSIRTTRNPSLIIFPPHSFKASTRKKLRQGKVIKNLSLPKLVVKSLQDFINIFTRRLSSDHLPPFFDPNCILIGNFSPVGELPPTTCTVVEGSLPPSLDGAYIQNGPNPQFAPRGPYHVLDGDGMLHAIKISRGEAKLCSRFVETTKYKLERHFGFSIFPNLFAFVNQNVSVSMVLALAWLFARHSSKLIHGFGPANTSLALFGGRLMALVESDLPYAIKVMPDGDIVTLGRTNFDSREFFITMTAHPKVDPDTGEAFAFRYFFSPPYLTYFIIGTDGRKHKDVPILSMKEGSLIHDFAVTRNFAVFPETQISIDGSEFLKGRRIMRFDRDKVPKLGVIPRYAEDDSEMYWLDAPGLNVLHVINAWEEGGGDGETNIVILATNVLSVEHALGRLELLNYSLEMITIDAKRKRVSNRRRVSDMSLDFGVINPRYGGKKNRYIYAGVMEKMPRMVGVVKIDLSLSETDCGDSCVVTSRMYGEGCFGSEPIFVAREPEKERAEEDDGYLLSYLYNENTDESHFMVMDAKSPSLETVAAVKLPRRVPYGFHSIFVKETDLNQL